MIKLLPAKFKSPSFAKGLTLIEGLMVIAIVGIFVTLIVPAFQTFNRNQTLKTAAIDLKSNLRLAQDHAFSGRREDAGGNCAAGNQLLGWYVSFLTIEPSKYYVRGLCADGTAFSGKDANLPTGVTITAVERVTPLPLTIVPDLYVLFRTVRADVGFYSAISSPYPGPEIVGATEFKITLGFASKQYDVHIKSTGEIYESKP